MAKIDPDLAVQLAGDQSARLDVIITSTGNLDDLLSFVSGDLEVLHRYELISGAAVRGSAGAINKLSKLPVVAAIEPVRDVGSW